MIANELVNKTHACFRALHLFALLLAFEMSRNEPDICGEKCNYPSESKLCDSNKKQVYLKGQLKAQESHGVLDKPEVLA